MKFLKDEHKREFEEYATSGILNNVNHPSHYNHGGRETIDIIKDHLDGSDWNAYQGGLLFNVYKYIDRSPYKGKRLEDLEKARWYLDKLIEVVGND